MELLMQGAVLMVIGMATVFAFLALLVFAMNRSAAFFLKYAHLFPEEAKADAKRPAPNPLEEIAVALAAVRARRG